MDVATLLFWIIAIILVGAALLVVGLRNIVHSALALVVVFAMAAGIYLLLNAEFIAIVQILIYAGAVTILILFALMLTRVQDMPAALDGPQKPFAFLAALGVLSILITAAVGTTWPGQTEKINAIPLRDFGDALFRTWALPFEIASLVLMVALIGAIVLARGEEGE